MCKLCKPLNPLAIHVGAPRYGNGTSALPFAYVMDYPLAVRFMDGMSHDLGNRCHQNVMMCLDLCIRLVSNFGHVSGFCMGGGLLIKENDVGAGWPLILDGRAFILAPQGFDDGVTPLSPRWNAFRRRTLLAREADRIRIDGLIRELRQYNVLLTISSRQTPQSIKPNLKFCGDDIHNLMALMICHNVMPYYKEVLT
ncbi:MAG: hypothetical protein ACYC6N_04995 [Pirellulaceae bacterium]